MTRSTCLDTYREATDQRIKYPLKRGRYKLAEAMCRLKRVDATLERRGIRPDIYSITAPKPSPLCMDYEFGKWTKDVPVILANTLGYDVFPAIMALGGDGYTEKTVGLLKHYAREQIDQCLEDGEEQRQKLKTSRPSKAILGELRTLVQTAMAIVQYALELETGHNYPAHD